jgi:hypothetical protein
MAGYEGFPGARSGIQVAVSTGSHPDHQPEDHSGNQKLFSPLEHKDGDVSLDDVWFSTLSKGVSAFSQQSFTGALDPGTLVYVLKGIGEGGGIILGQSNGILKGGAGQGGGGQSLGAQTVKDLQQTKIPVNTPPDIEDTEERGVKVRKIKEKGEEHSLSMLEGLPIHGALFNMTGFKLPEVKQVPTATQTNDGMMNANMLQQMVGQVMSLGQMFQGMKGKAGGGAGGMGSMGSNAVSINPGIAENGNTHFENVLSSLSPNMFLAMNSMANLVQGMETSSGITFVTGGVVHEETYYRNAAELLSQVTTIDDLMYALQRLQWDTSLFGQENLEPQTYTINTAFGIVTQYVDYDGEITIDYDANVANAIEEWANTVNDANNSPGVGSSPPPSSGGGGSGGGGSGGIGQISSMMNNMFGKSSEVMKDMFKRLTPEGEKEAKQMHEKLNKDEKSKKMWGIVTATTEGQDPLDKQHYDKQTGGAQ